VSAVNVCVAIVDVIANTLRTDINKILSKIKIVIQAY
jgi:hypothetical protein